MKNKIYFKGVEILDSTNQAIIFAKKLRGHEYGCSIIINMVMMESKKEEMWTFIDNEIQKALETLENFKG